MKKYIYIFISLAVLVLIILTSINAKRDGSNLFGIPPEGKTYVDVVVQNNVQYSLVNPEGWLRLTQSESQQGTPLIYARDGESLETAKAIIFSQTTAYRNGGSVLKIIKEDEDEIIKQKNTVKNLGTLEIQGKNGGRSQTAYLRSYVYKNKAEGSVYSTAAYIDAGNATVMIIMQAFDEKFSTELYPVFEKLVQSYKLYEHK